VALTDDQIATIVDRRTYKFQIFKLVWTSTENHVFEGDTVSGIDHVIETLRINPFIGLKIDAGEGCISAWFDVVSADLAALRAAFVEEWGEDPSPPWPSPGPIDPVPFGS